MLALLMLMQAAAAQPPERSCFGGGTANKVTMTNIDASGSNYSQVGGMPYSSYGSGSATVMGQRHQGFADQVDIDFSMATIASAFRGHCCRLCTGGKADGSSLRMWFPTRGLFTLRRR